MKACIIFNPAARGEKAERFRYQVGTVGTGAVLKLTTAPGDARRLAAEATANGFNTIIAAGGDGTLNEVLNGIGDERNGYQRVRLATIPLGTVNVFAREIGMPSDLRQSWKIIEAGRERRIDLPSARFLVNGKSEDRRFLQLAGAGWDARVVEAVSLRLKRRIGQLAYIYAGLCSLSGSQARIKVQHDAGEMSGELVIIGNGRFYGGNLPLLAQADYADGLLDICVVDKVSWLTFPFVGIRLAASMVVRSLSKYHFRAKELQLSSDQRALLQLEGDPVGTLPATISVEPNKLRVIVA